jgi:hypothetical protein
LSNDTWLILPDLQIPFEADGSLEFCRKIKKEFGIPDENVLNVGDEVDQYFGSLYKKNPDSPFSAAGELELSIKKLKDWYKAFPKMKLAVSNHGMRWAKRAVEAEIPSQMIRAYQEIIEAPNGWVWKQEWLIKCEWPFRMIHGMGYSGQTGARNAAIDAGMSTVMGHLHAHAGISYIKTSKDFMWGFNVGCLIDNDAFAFEYNRQDRNKPIRGCGVVMESGKTPVFFPFGEP